MKANDISIMGDFVYLKGYRVAILVAEGIPVTIQDTFVQYLKEPWTEELEFERQEYYESGFDHGYNKAMMDHTEWSK